MATCLVTEPTPSLGAASVATCLVTEPTPSLGAASVATCLVTEPTPSLGAASVATCLVTEPRNEPRWPLASSPSLVTSLGGHLPRHRAS